MPYLLRRRLSCFYCGHKSSHYKGQNIRQWQCSQCDAVNHLDENGEITDPPSSSSLQDFRKFATDSARTVSPDLAAADNRIFCTTCQKNQHIFVETLATYLPDPSDPTYNEYERNLPAYRRQLEERYPQVCANCVHLVNNRIESMTYLARTENLKLTLDKTRKGLMPYQGRTRWKGVIIFFGGCMWWTAILGQLIWHLLGLTLSLTDEGPSSLQSCLIQSVVYRKSDVGCYNSMTELVPTLLAAGWLSIWWNNKLSRSASGLGRLMNLNDYYSLQLIFLLLRTGAFWVISSQRHFSRVSSERVHGALVVFIVLLVISSLNTVGIKRPPTLADYKLKKVEAPSIAALTLDGSDFTPGTERQYSQNAFPLSAMAPSTSGPGSIFGNTSRRRLSESTDLSSVLDRRWLQEQKDEESSEMDWTPTQSTLNPRQPVKSKLTERSYTPQQSPFKHSLPAAPEHPAHKARKPPTQPTFYRASEEKRNDFKANLDKSAMFDSWGLPTVTKSAHEMPMGAAKLGVTQQETGLENLFNNVFSLQDEPQEFRITALPNANSSQQSKSLWSSVTIWTLLLSIPISVGSAWLMTKQSATFSWNVTDGFPGVSLNS